MVVTRLDKKKPTTLTPSNLEAPINSVSQPINTGEINPIQTPVTQPVTPTPIETPKIEPITIEAPKVDTTQEQVKTTFGGGEMRDFGVNAPIQEKTTTTTPEGKTEVVKETQAPTGITKDTKWETTDKSMNSLEQIVEARYGTIATQKDGKLQAQIGDKMYEWSIDPKTGSPVKTEVQLSQADMVKNQLLNKYITANADVLYNAMINGDISPEMRAGLVANPNFAIAEEKARKQQSVNNTNSQVEGMYNTITGKEGLEIDVVQNLSDRVITGKVAAGATEEDLLDYSNFLGQDEELKTAVTDLNGKVQLKREIERTIKDRTDELISQYPGMTKGAAMVLSARQNKDLYNQLDFLNDDILTLQSTVAYKEKILDKEYDTKVKAQQLEEQRAYEQSLKADERAYNEGLQTRQLEQEYQYQYGDLNSTNPTLQNIAIERAVAGMYENYPIPGMESQSVKTQKVKDLMASGLTGTQAVQQVENEIRGSQRYKDYLASEKVKLLGGSTQDWSKLDDNTLFNQKTGETKSVTQDAPTSTVTPTGTYTTLKYNSATGSSREMKVDKVATPSLMTALTSLGNGLVVGETFRTRERQTELYNAYKNGTGGLAAPPGQSKHEKGLAIDVYADANYAPLSAEQVKVMNANGWYQTAGEEDLGHFEYVGTTGTNGATERQYTDNDIALLSAVTKLDKQGRETLKENGFNEQDWANFNAGLLPPTTSQKTEANKVIGLVNKLAQHKGLNNAVGYKGPIGTFTTIAGSEKANFESLFNTLVDSLAASNLDKIKGAMSDKDIEFLRNIEKNGLNYDSSEAQFKEQLSELSQRYNAILTRGGIQPTMTIPNNTSTGVGTTDDPLGLFDN